MNYNHMPCPKCRRPVLIEIGARCEFCGTKIPAMQRAIYNINRPTEHGEFTPTIIILVLLIIAALFAILL